jgi:type III secretory pathway lipoprotein EscJ
MTYTIAISEAQRLRLIKILKSVSLPKESRNEVDQVFIDCLAELPEVEKKHPGAVHALYC